MISSSETPKENLTSILSGVSNFPNDDGEPVFRAPWEAQAFALTLHLFNKGLFTWPEWAEILTDEIKLAQKKGDPDLGQTYYNHWLNALERIVETKKLTNSMTLAKYQKAWRQAAERTPHGLPIELTQHDFEP
jgi:nitrile hydratase accessory protein